MQSRRICDVGVFFSIKLKEQNTEMVTDLQSHVEF